MPSRRDVIEHYERLYERGYGSPPSSSTALIAGASKEFRALGVSSVLDVGCGRCALLEALEAHGFDVAGTEVVDRLLREYGAQWSVHPASAQELTAVVGSRSYDLVTLCDVLDHLADEDEARLGLKQAAEVARLGVCAAVNSESVERTIDRSAEWWRGLFTEHFSTVEVVRRDAVRLVGRRELP